MFRKVILPVLGAIVGLGAVALLAAGGFVLWANHTQRDSAGFFTTKTHVFETSSYAITHQGTLDIGDLGSLANRGRLGAIRVRATSHDGKPIFVGVAPKSAVDRYMSGVAHAVVDDVDNDPFRVTYDRKAGGAPAAAPTAQRFWKASVSGTGTQTLVWPIEKGKWSVAVMNADGSRDVVADVSLGAKVNFLGWIATGLLAGGAILLLVGGLLIVLGVGGSGSPAPAPARSPVPAGAYPVAVEAKVDEPLSRWLWLVKWILALPHAVVLALLWLVVPFATFAAWIAILVTGRYPRAIFEYNLGVLRWTWRVSWYAFGGVGTDRYPPFTLADVDYPARVDVAFPTQLSRGRVLVQSWLLAIPHLVIVGFFVGGGTAFGDHWGFSGLVGVLSVIAGAFLLFTGRYPRELAAITIGLQRWTLRVAAYVLLMTDRYPPFRLDQGETEAPGPLPAAPAPVA